jgi:hypothetical protein
MEPGHFEGKEISDKLGGVRGANMDGCLETPSLQ